MKKQIVQINFFSKNLATLLKQRRLLPEDFEIFKRDLLQNSQRGDLISGTGGVRKTRLKSSSRGKSGGFRVCYFDDQKNNILFLLFIYPKNEQENITPSEKQILKNLTAVLKGIKNEQIL